MSLIEMPRLGYGTWGHDTDTACIENTVRAIESGYRHLDTAQRYHNEREVGTAIAAADVSREELFVATKVRQQNLAYDDCIESVEQSLERLGVDDIDLLYVHWPKDTYDPDETARALDELYDRGVVRHLGVSNFTPTLLDELRDALDAPVVANQVEFHPLLVQNDLLEYARAHDMWLVAYSPLARGAVLDVPAVNSVAERLDVTPAQATLAWLLSKPNVATIPGASGSHVVENIGALDVELDPTSEARIDAIEETHRVVDPEDAPWA